MRNVWNAFWSPRLIFAPVEPSTSIRVLSVDGNLQAPVLFDVKDPTSFAEMRAHVYAEISHTGDLEESYVFRLLPSGKHVLWYNVSTKDAAYGVVMGYEPEKKRFTSIAEQETITLPQESQQTPPQSTHKTSSPANNNKAPSTLPPLILPKSSLGNPVALDPIVGEADVPKVSRKKRPTLQEEAEVYLKGPLESRSRRRVK